MTIRKCLETFLHRYSSMLPANSVSGENGFHAEFQELQEEQNQRNAERAHVTREGWKDPNRKKNRYKDIVPFDETRVKLTTLHGLVCSDYINASYVKGANGHNSYIAAQGPLPSTTGDFWRMMWEKNVHVIIMTCKEEEGGKSKCERYWPFRGETKSFHNINVVMESEEMSYQKDFFIRDFKLTCEEETRMIKQFHYTSWPDHDIPDSVTPMLDMIAYIRDYQPGETTPLVVHCSAGCGRTGTLCAIDICWSLLKLGKIDSSFSLYKVISDMRKQRYALVQTREQYQFACKAVAELFSSHLEIIKQNLYENVELGKQSEEDYADEEQETNMNIKITDEDYVNASVLKKMMQVSPTMTISIRKTVKAWEKHINETDSIALRLKSRPVLLPKPKTPDATSTSFQWQDTFKTLEKEPLKVPLKVTMTEKSNADVDKVAVPKVASAHEKGDKTLPKVTPKLTMTQESNVTIEKVTAPKLPSANARSRLYEEINEIVLPSGHNVLKKPQKPSQFSSLVMAKKTKNCQDVDEGTTSNTPMPVKPPRHAKNGSLKRSSGKKEFPPEPVDLYATVDRGKKQNMNQEIGTDKQDDEKHMAPAVPVKTKQSLALLSSKSDKIFDFPKRIGRPKGERPPPTHWKKVM